MSSFRWLVLSVALRDFRSLNDRKCIFPVVTAAGPSSNFNPCSAAAVPSGHGFKGIDSTNRVTYVECLNYEVLQSYECLDGTYFDEQSVRCVTGTWVDSSDSTSLPENVCIAVYDGFIAIDSTTYAECVNYVEMGRYSCPVGFYFSESMQQCTEENDGDATASMPSPSISTESDNSLNPPSSIETSAATTCQDITDGQIPLDSLQGWLVCNNGEVLVTEYCGSSKLYNIDYGVCVNYCEGRTISSDSFTSLVQLPKLAGQITCDDALEISVESIICTPGTYFDIDFGYCRDFCKAEVQQFISFPNQEGGVTCQNGNTIRVEWCGSGAIFSTMIGACMQTDSPSLSPITADPTLPQISEAPTNAPAKSLAEPTDSPFPPTLYVTVPPTPPTSSFQPTLGLVLTIDYPGTNGEENLPEGLVEVPDNVAGCLQYAIFLRITLVFGIISGLIDLL